MTNRHSHSSLRWRHLVNFKSGIAGASATVLAVLVMTVGAQAQMTDAQKAAIKSSCRSDYISNCMSVKPGGIEALQCLQTHMAKLSPACQTAVGAATPKPAAPPPPAAAAAPPPPPPAAAPPPPKAAAAPPPAPAPAVATAPPPVQHKPKPKAAAKPPASAPKQAVAVPPPPPPAAAEALPAPTAAQLKAIKVTCRGDFRRDCRGVPPGGAQAIACLQLHAATLSPDCKVSLADIADTALPPTPVNITPPPPGMPNAPIVMTAVIGRACLRDLALHCRDTGIGDGQKIACLMARGPQLAPLCKAALKITEPVR